MIQCRKCKNNNPAETAVCQSCGADLLPGAAVRDRLGSLIVGIVGAAIGLGLAFVCTRLPADAPDCLPTSPTTWILVAFIGLISGMVGLFVKTPPFERYAARSKRHLELDPEQALQDLSKAIELAPEKKKAPLLEERSKLYAKLGRTEEATKDRLDYTFTEGAYGTGAGLAGLIGADKDTYVSSSAASERQQMMAEGKIIAMGFCPKCGKPVQLSPKLRCQVHESVKAKAVQFGLPADAANTEVKVLTAYQEQQTKSRKQRLTCGIVLGILAVLCLISVIVSQLGKP